MNARDCQHGSLARQCLICELEEEIAELKAHIERWKVQSLSKYVEHEPDHEGTCFVDGIKWPCPTEVAKGWEHPQKLITGDYPKHGDATSALHD